jgi:hypothetical protein
VLVKGPLAHPDFQAWGRRGTCQPSGRRATSSWRRGRAVTSPPLPRGLEVAAVGIEGPWRVEPGARRWCPWWSARRSSTCTRPKLSSCACGGARSGPRCSLGQLNLSSWLRCLITAFVPHRPRAPRRHTWVRTSLLRPPTASYAPVAWAKQFVTATSHPGNIAATWACLRCCGARRAYESAGFWPPSLLRLAFCTAYASARVTGRHSCRWWHGATLSRVIRGPARWGPPTTSPLARRLASQGASLR